LPRAEAQLGRVSLGEALAKVQQAYLIVASAEAFADKGLDAAVPRHLASQGEASALFALPLSGAAPEVLAAMEASTQVVGLLPGLSLSSLGDPSFCRDYGLKFPYVAGAMANGISSVELVEAMGRAGCLGIFGAAGLTLNELEQALLSLQEKARASSFSFGMNLIHSPSEPSLEEAVVDLYLRYGVQQVSASAYLALTPAVVRYRLKGLRLGPDQKVIATNRILAKVSRVEVAEPFLSPPPAKIVAALLSAGAITEEEAALAPRLPMADDLSVEADSGGHTDNRPAISLFPTMLALRDRLQRDRGYETLTRLGAAGGISTPASAAAAFAMGADYIVVGSVHQACVESGTSDLARQLLAESGQADVTMAPAADMFEMGVKLQVLKRGTLFAQRASKLYELYRRCAGLDEIRDAERVELEQKIFRMPLEQVWEETCRFFEARDPSQIARAAKDPKHKMALLFRWYLGSSSAWAKQGVQDRRVDFQIWCGPAMGAFNEWTRGSFLEQPGDRKVVVVAMNLLYGAAYLLRKNLLQMQGLRDWVPSMSPTPQTLDGIEEVLN